jgi:uncharacterized spore protein YtfJ
MALERVKEMLERAAQSARIDTAYGEARQVNGKTIIPVARVTYGGGGGEGKGKGDDGGEGEGGGGGLGVHVQPLGVFVVTEQAERWVPVIDVTRVVLAGCAVATLALLTIGKIAGRRR